ncbi:LtrC [Sporosarcina sp. resist]|uniref:ArdC family protein n=1 Tax=Sporosarcina sp. resist TaxID=2762563 RepID=UPI00164E80F5|nr:ArdC family protein [Sporosarcina sp. resist]QNK89117.1 LtrC [Sporosarcina sp. resist]
MSKRETDFKKRTWEEKKQEIDELTKGMEQQIPSYFRSPEGMKAYLDFMGKFHNYSLNNTLLIEGQFQGAEAVGSFAFWKSKGFFVNKGEKGIKILVPKTTTYFNRGDKEVQLKFATKEEKEKIATKQIATNRRTYFDIGNVFDVSQTNATVKDLPAIFPNRWLEGSVENYQTMFQALEKIADKHGVQIIDPRGELGAALSILSCIINRIEK